MVTELRNPVSIQSVAKKTNLSSSTITRILDTIHYTCPLLKDALSIDEFKGNTDAGKYQCVLVEPIKKLEHVRKRLQKTMPSTLRKYYKRSRKLILHRYQNLKDKNKKACDLMLHYNDDLRKAHYLKEWFYEICKQTKYSLQRTAFIVWIKNAENYGIPEFEKCAVTYINWSKEILNAFKYGLTNGPTEGFNNKIKVLKRIT